MKLNLKKEDNGLELAAAAAFMHPDPELRGRLSRTLRECLAIDGQSTRENSIRELLRSTRGTDTEPFILSEAHCELAVFYAEMCFRHRGFTRFRVAGEDAIMDGASVILTNNGRGYFLPLSKAKKRFGSMPSFCRGRAFWEGRPMTLPKASLKVTDKGVVLACSWPFADGEKVRLEAPQSGMRKKIKYPVDDGVKMLAGSEAIPLKDIDAFQTSENWGVRTKSEAGEIRFLAACEQGVSAVVDGVCRSTFGGPEKIFSRLRVPLQYPETNLTLPVELHAAADCYHWINFRTGISVDLTDADRTALAAWFFPHPAWPDGNV